MNAAGKHKMKLPRGIWQRATQERFNPPKWVRKHFQELKKDLVTTYFLKPVKATSAA